MSIQFNFFATDSDAEFIASRIVTLSDKLAVFPDHSRKELLQVTPVRDAHQLTMLTPGKIWLIVRAEDANEVVIEDICDGVATIKLNNDRVIEYSPCSQMEDGIIKIGRIYTKSKDPVVRQQVKRIIKELKSIGSAMNASDLWLFPEARKKARKLRPWAGKDFDNPGSI